jgi:hypothetical protein
VQRTVGEGERGEGEGRDAAAGGRVGCSAGDVLEPAETRVAVVTTEHLLVSHDDGLTITMLLAHRPPPAAEARDLVGQLARLFWAGGRQHHRMANLRLVDDPPRFTASKGCQSLPPRRRPGTAHDPQDRPRFAGRLVVNRGGSPLPRNSAPVLDSGTP